MARLLTQIDVVSTSLWQKYGDIRPPAPKGVTGSLNAKPNRLS